MKKGFLHPRERRQRRVRSKIRERGFSPRLSVFRSNKHIFAQIINDSTGETLVSMSDLGFSADKKQTKVTKSFWVGERLATEALKRKIKTVVFDRGSYAFHGRVKSLSEGARKGGLKF